MNEKRLATAIPFAANILRSHRVKIQKHFRTFAVRKYVCKPQQVTFENTIKLLRKVSLVDMYNLGETDGTCIDISQTVPMSFDELVGVLVHECLHNYCKVRGKYMSCHNEHTCMRGLGDLVCA